MVQLCDKLYTQMQLCSNNINFTIFGVVLLSFQICVRVCLQGNIVKSYFESVTHTHNVYKVSSTELTCNLFIYNLCACLPPCVYLTMKTVHTHIVSIITLSADRQLVHICISPFCSASLHTHAH
jgi:hypothetical protein